MQRKTLIAAATAMLLAAGGFAIAQQQPAPRVAVDADKDGVITRAEAAAHPRLAERFDTLDKNKDGRLTADERPMMGRGKPGKGGPDGRRGKGGGWTELDTDKDDRLSQAEAAARPQMAQRFATLDANRDGYLDKADFEARRTARQAECFTKADADRNGSLSRAEFDRMHEVCGMQRGPRPGNAPR